MTNQPNLPASKWSDEEIGEYCAEVRSELEAVKEIEAEKEIFESLAERNERVLSRYSVFDLREMSEADLDAGIEKLEGKDLEIVGQGVSDNCISWFRVRSARQIYEVRRFENFCFCPCADFFFSQSEENDRSPVCKHIALTTAPICLRCKRRAAKKHGEKCSICEQQTAPYLKQRVQKPVTIIGGIRV